MLLKAENISHTYHNHNYRMGHTSNEVLHDVDLTIAEGETVGLLGPSGSGKSTLGQIIAGLHEPSDGHIYFHDKEIKYPYRGRERQKIQVMFQHPESVLNPRRTIIQSMEEVYRLYNIKYSKEGLVEMLKPFGIYEAHIMRLPAQLSGGELQRIALARVLLLEPELIVLDEPTSMLDTISQAQIMQMLMRLQKERGIAYLFITHDDDLCRFVSHKILKIEKGTILKGE